MIRGKTVKSNNFRNTSDRINKNNRIGNDTKKIFGKEKTVAKTRSKMFEQKIILSSRNVKKNPRSNNTPRKNTNTRSYTPPKRNNNTPRTNSQPRSNNNTPRSYSPP